MGKTLDTSEIGEYQKHSKVWHIKTNEAEIKQSSIIILTKEAPQCLQDPATKAV